MKKIGPYEIEGVLGRGGMGTVYRGVHIHSNEKHAVKVLSPNFADDPHFRGRFESEIKALLKLDHDNIVSLLSYGQEDGQLFFAMELVEGQSLFQMQRARHKFDWRQVLAVARDCAEGLRHAHDRGVIHRDLKPGNLMMANSNDGSAPRVKLTDFGIAKRFGNSQNTGTNILGTMDFMSPEQAKGEPVTAKSDLYSLGTVLYTLLSGRPPFSGNSVEESLRNLTRVPAPQVSVANPDVPRPLEKLISKLMEKKPDDRVPTALALIHKLNEIEEELRDDSEAKTAHDGVAATIELKSAKPEPTKTVADNKPNKRSLDQTLDEKPKQVNVPTPDLPVAATDELELEPATAEKQDYFNTVTETLRRQELETYPEPEQTSKGLLPLLLAFACVIAIGIYGWVRATAPPTAEQLFTTIQDKAQEPDRVLDEINQFLELYPDESRADNIAKLQKAAEAIYKYRTLANTLTVRSRSPEGLSEVESKFLELANLASESPSMAAEKMRAFVRFNESFELEPRDQDCVDAAIGFAVKLKFERRTKAQQQLARIQAAMIQANKITDINESLKVYQSTLELYKDVDWRDLPNPKRGRSILAEVKGEIARLENEVRMDLLEKELERKRAEAEAGGEENDASDGDANEDSPAESSQAGGQL
jgi:serine/threonine-protein kinase